MKTITKISSALMIAGLLSFSANSFAQSSGSQINPVNENSGTVKRSNCLVFVAVLTSTNEKCYGNANAMAGLIATLGTGPYTFAWSPTATNFAFDSLDGANGLAAGSYTVTATDANGCTGSTVVTITQPTQVTAKNTVTDDKCYGSNNGTAIVKATGGTPGKTVPYTYRWNPAVSTTDTGKNLTAGAYIVTITDSNKCTSNDTVTITQPVQIKTTSAIISSSCKTNDGSASIAASLGVSPYSYSWAPGGQTTDTIKGQGAGTYACTVTDANGCMVTANIIVTDSTTLATKVIAETNEKCYGNTTGLVQVHVSGGMGKVTYNWTPSGGTDTIAAGLAAGTYTFTATDSLGCKALLNVIITQPNQLRDSMTNIRNVACYGGATGRVTDGISGGTGPFTYSWSTGATTSNLNNVVAGSYSVTITDANGCMDSAKITLTQPATAVGDSNKVTTIACYGGTANALVYAFGGVHPYTYTWSGGSTNTSDTALGLSPGTYVCSIRDSNRCRVRDTIVVTQPPAFIISSNSSLGYPCSNQASVQVIGNLSKYTFSWSPSGGSSDTASNLCNGTYVATITDSTGCVERDTIVLDNAVGIAAINNHEGIKVYPVPARNQINISISGNGFMPENIAIYDVTE